MNIIFKWLAFGLVMFLIALVYTVPAHLIFPYLPQAVHIGRLNGTLWNAQATEFSFNGLSFSEVRWCINPLYLLTGRLKTSVEFSHSDMNGSGNIILGYRSLDLERLHVTGNTAVIDLYLDTLGASIDGKFDLTLESLDITHAGPQDAQGRMVVANARLLSPAELRLGNIEVNLKQQDDSAVATLTNSAANALRLTGTATILPEWRYRSDMRIAPTNITPEAVRQTLTLLGRADAKGTVTVKQSGEIPTFRWLPFLQDSASEVKD